MLLPLRQYCDEQLARAFRTALELTNPDWHMTDNRDIGVKYFIPWSPSEPVHLHTNLTVVCDLAYCNCEAFPFSCSKS